MPIKLDDFEKLTKKAVAHYWRTLASQEAKQIIGTADRGGRAAVTGGRQMDGFCKLVEHTLKINGLQKGSIYLNEKLELPGYFRPTKEWDMLVVHEGVLLAALEFKSQKGPSFGNNFNNRTEEAIGTAHDLWVAYREGAFGNAVVRPWVGWVMLLEDCEKSATPVSVSEPHYKVFPEFVNASYAKRYELLLRKLTREQLYNSTAFLLSNAASGISGRYTEVAEDLGMKQFLAGLAGQVATYLAAK